MRKKNGEICEYFEIRVEVRMYMYVFVGIKWFLCMDYGNFMCIVFVIYCIVCIDNIKCL